MNINLLKLSEFAAVTGGNLKEDITNFGKGLIGGDDAKGAGESMAGV